jgi:hypothetical protein
MQIVASYRVENPMVKSGLPLKPGTEISIGHWIRFTQETMRARSFLGICSAALVATSFATLAQAQVDRCDVLANSPMVENRPTPETAKLLKDEVAVPAGNADLPVGAAAHQHVGHVAKIIALRCVAAP